MEGGGQRERERWRGRGRERERDTHTHTHTNTHVQKCTPHLQEKYDTPEVLHSALSYRGDVTAATVHLCVCVRVCVCVCVCVRAVNIVL